KRTRPGPPPGREERGGLGPRRQRTVKARGRLDVRHGQAWRSLGPGRRVSDRPDLADVTRRRPGGRSVGDLGNGERPPHAAPPEDERDHPMSPTPPVSLWPERHALGPVTDLYQLTMMAGYFASGMDRKQATFELFIRRLPPHRSYLVFAGLEQAIGDLLSLRFSAEQVEGIRRFPAFSGVDPAFFSKLASIRFEGDVWAVPEGTVVFPGETLLRVTAPLPQAQWVETFLLASLSYPTLVASKAARAVTVAAGRALYDFGARRGHGPH